jgi:hypothetical protein
VGPVAELSAARRSKTVERILVELDVVVRVVGECVGVLGGEEVDAFVLLVLDVDDEAVTVLLDFFGLMSLEEQ